MAIRFVTIHAAHGPDRLLVAFTPHRSGAECCSVVSPGDGTAELDALRLGGRVLVASRARQWLPWQPEPATGIISTPEAGLERAMST